MKDVGDQALHMATGHAVVKSCFFFCLIIWMTHDDTP
jgi:hypothetical protein